ncbi:TNF receptor-associated factor 3-like [Saccostrea cucullata]|uniref:TNF receptor-associated factor 3-like n=1 Tax=Saccostrea cuccullata TaxID=36930 RepID=UPI002ED40FAB
MDKSLTSLGSSLLTSTELPHFVEKLPPKYVCPVCNFVLRNAMQLQCGHQICEPCIDPLFGEDETATCPVNTDEECEEPFTKNEVYKDMCTRREIMLLQVYCSYSGEGCQEILQWRNLQKHTEICEFKPVECEDCHEKIPQNKLLAHKESECSYRIIVCEHCSHNVPFCQMQSHIDHECPEYPLNCPNGCENVTLKRSEMENHLQSCPKRPIPCGYKTIGCTYVNVVKEVEKHQATATDHHLMLVMSFSGQTSDQNKAVQEEIEKSKKETEELKSIVQELRQENQRLKEEIQPLVKSLTKDMKKKLVTLTERLINLERMFEHQPKKEVLEKQEQVINSLREDLRVSQEQITQIERAGPSGGGTEAAMPQEVRNQLKNNEKQMAIQDIRLAELDLRFQVLETASYDGILMWKIRDYSRRKQEAKSGRTLSLYSQPFYTSRTGYKMCARVYLNGDGMGKGTHLSLFFVVMRGEYDALLPWPFQQKVSLMLLDQDNFRRHVCDTFQPDTTSSSFKRPTTEMNVATGCPLFISHSVLETKTYLKDDTIFIKVKVDTSNIPVL